MKRELVIPRNARHDTQLVIPRNTRFVITRSTQFVIPAPDLIRRRDLVTGRRDARSLLRIKSGAGMTSPGVVLPAR